MKINKLKILLIAICCLVSASHSETQGMENIALNAQHAINFTLGDVVAAQRSETDRLDNLSQEFINYKLQIEQEREASNRILDQFRQQLEQYQRVNEDLNNRLLNVELMASQRGSAKAWIFFDGTKPDTSKSEGVLSIIKNSTGDYTINFSRPFNSKEYCSILSAGNGNNGSGTTTTGHMSGTTEYSFRFLTYSCYDWSMRDPLYVSACFYGDH